MVGGHVGWPMEACRRRIVALATATSSPTYAAL
eukprot:CAMPEP_0194364580 /NCGR_PEP_ID=MMETSP0174-20130528/12459_1 /TAXON_ID=216777 /ORGANISM="Proboscia alata, Strain PI-D3" /LENGTH=32 /DNA_ID= /DNA_START= /DNA_END= /DNA_ORIENTATION=